MSQKAQNGVEIKNQILKNNMPLAPYPKVHDITFFCTFFLKEIGSERACQLKNLDDFATSQTIPLCKN